MESFVINLSDRIQRWNNFEKLNLGIKRLDAVDTRNQTKLKKSLLRFGLNLLPADKLSKLYFKNSIGAVGCYLSHYVFWKQVIDNNFQQAVVFEDDALCSDVEHLLKTTSYIKLLESDKPVLIQLNKRTTPDKLPFWFDGTESYALNNSAANALINLTHDFSDFKNQKIEYAWDVKNTNVKKKNLYDMWKHHDLNINYIKKNSIRYAVDKFIGYCSLSCVNPINKLKIHIQPKISLFENNIPSDVIKNAKFWWNMDLNTINNLTKDL